MNCWSARPGDGSRGKNRNGSCFLGLDVELGRRDRPLPGRNDALAGYATAGEYPRANSLLALFAQGFADASEVVPTVADGVVFDDELRGDGSAEAEREGRGGVKLFVCESSNGGGGFATITAKQFERPSLGDLGVVGGVIAVQLRDSLPGDIGEGFAAADGAGEVHFYGIDEGDVVNDDANGPAVSGIGRPGGTPLGFGKAFHERGQTCGAFFDTIGQ